MKNNVSMETTMNERYETFTMLITKIKRNISRLKAEEMVAFDLKSSHVNCLYYISRYGSLTAAELSELCCDDKAAISRAVSHLEKCGFVYCRENGGRKRYNAELSLTQSGKEVAERLSTKISQVLDEASAGLDDEKRHIMYESLAAISENLEKINLIEIL